MLLSSSVLFFLGICIIPSSLFWCSVSQTVVHSVLVSKFLSSFYCTTARWKDAYLSLWLSCKFCNFCSTWTSYPSCVMFREQTDKKAFVLELLCLYFHGKIRCWSAGFQIVCLIWNVFSVQKCIYKSGRKARLEEEVSISPLFSSWAL